MDLIYTLKNADGKLRTGQSGSVCIAKLRLLVHTWILCRNTATIPLPGTAVIVNMRDSPGL